MEPEELKKHTENLLKAARDGASWLIDNQEKQGNQEGKLKRLRHSARLLENYARAAGNKMGIAVFGPSQVGKSTMISALAKPPRGKLVVDFQGERLDFITQVNPQGGAETTGLVTRFSIEPPPISPDSSLPVCLKLFSEMDIIKILANTYFAEAKGGADVDRDLLDSVLTKLESKHFTPSHAPSLDQMEDLQEYIEGISSIYTSGRDLSSFFWPRALPLAQKLDIEERAELLSFIWGNIPQFTNVYKKLYHSIKNLNFPDVAFTEVEALNSPKDFEETGDGRLRSVLHVGMLMGLLENQNDTVKVISIDGKRANLERAVLSALIAELHVKVQENPGDFMLKADILDFPGYRSRKKYANFKDEVQDPLNLKDCFLRGKVAYVFERYSNQKEITAMLLCLRDGNVDCPDLPGVINDWIGDAHGKNPEERSGKPICLFLVLTFFNMHLIRDEASTDLRKVWANRFKASIGDTFKKDGWPDQWAKEAGEMHRFTNCFWLLNVFRTKDYLITELVDKDNDVYISKGVRDDKKEWIEELKQAYLTTDEVNYYIQNPLEAWNGALESSDGGTGYIIAKLNPLLEKDLKTRQLMDLAFREGERVMETLEKFHKSGNTDQERAAKQKSFYDLTRSLVRLGNPQGQRSEAHGHRFGLLLSDLLLTDDECYEIFSRPFLAPPASEKEQLDTHLRDDTEFYGDDDFDNPFKPPEEKGEAGKGLTKVAFPQERRDDDATNYRRLLEKEWQEGLERLLANDLKRRYYSFKPSEFQVFINELVQGAHRQGVMATIENKLRRALGYGNVNPKDLIWKISRIASAGISNYVNYLGFNPREKISQRERTIKYQDKDRLLFEVVEYNEEYPSLPVASPDYESPYHMSWIFAL
ncbi:MAG: putative virulence factor, partial [Deltaproteobacteria bacterium]|nr:putative virulence factor [Deltaproteobacteria bacterium]